LNERVSIVAQLPDHGVRLIDKLNDSAAGISAGTPNRNAREFGDPLNALRAVRRGEIHSGWLGLGSHHNARELRHVQDLASFSASVLHLHSPLILPIA
jgi:hypothetical protein